MSGSASTPGNTKTRMITCGSADREVSSSTTGTPGRTSRVGTSRSLREQVLLFTFCFLMKITSTCNVGSQAKGLLQHVKFERTCHSSYSACELACRKAFSRREPFRSCIDLPAGPTAGILNTLGRGEGCVQSKGFYHCNFTIGALTGSWWAFLLLPAVLHRN